MLVHDHLDSPLGPLLVTASEAGVTGLYFPEHRRGPAVDPDWGRDASVFAQLREELDAYWRGQLETFGVPLDLRGSPFQREVWARLRRIPAGTTTTYGSLAASVDRPTGARAVAGAVARNPVSIVVPCHRVIGANGSLTGYAGGSVRKQHLLALEGVALEGVALEGVALGAVALAGVSRDPVSS